MWPIQPKKKENETNKFPPFLRLQNLQFTL